MDLVILRLFYQMVALIWLKQLQGGGFGISSHIIKLTSGFDQSLAIINQSLGKEVSFKNLFRKPTSLCFFIIKKIY